MKLIKVIGISALKISLMVWGFSEMCFSSQLPGFMQKYCAKIPHLQQYQEVVLHDHEKADVIARYFCHFIPQKPDLCINGIDVLKEKIFQRIAHHQDISLILLGFPFKSTNHEKKCLGACVDLGEYLSLTTLHIMLYNIRSIYPKITCTIISDGLSYHVNGYDPSYDDICAYHAAMERLVTCFSGISFISWKVNDGILSYDDLQQKVAAMPLPSDTEFSVGYKKEMKAFVTKEFDCTLWKNIFVKKAQEDYAVRNLSMKDKDKKQEINRIVNVMMEQKKIEVVNELGNKGKQFSTFISTSYPDYQNSIRLSVHCNKNDIDVSKKLPISLVYDCIGTPWHNAVVVDKRNSEVLGFAKDYFRCKKANISTQKKKSLSVSTGENQHVPLKYIAISKG